MTMGRLQVIEGTLAFGSGAERDRSQPGRRVVDVGPGIDGEGSVLALMLDEPLPRSSIVEGEHGQRCGLRLARLADAGAETSIGVAEAGE
jgi:hypothetical protein